MMFFSIKPLRNFLFFIINLLLLGIGATSQGNTESQITGLAREVIPAAQLEKSSLKLIGTAWSRSAAQRLAVIMDTRNKRQWVFHEGDRAGHVHIKEILRDKVIIDAGNGDRVVRLWWFLVRGSGTVSSPVGKKLQIIKRPRLGQRERHYLLDRR